MSLLLVAAGLSGCALGPVSAPAEQAAPEVVSLNLQTRLFGERPRLVSMDVVHELTPSQQSEFLRFFNDPKKKDIAGHRRVLQFLELEANQFSYASETFTAAEALERRAGNCLSLAIVTTSLARLAGVDMDYQLINTNPVFEANGRVVRRTQHVRSILYDPTWEVPDGFWTVSRPRITIDYFPGKLDRMVGKISEHDYYALYFQNLAADEIERENYAAAYWFLMQALEYSELSPESLNMMAIVFDRVGDKDRSETIYRFGIAHAERRVSLLRNYGIFLLREGRTEEAAQINAELAALDDPNPFDWIYAGRQAFRDGEFNKAIHYFEKSAALAPYLHESYFGLAKTYLQMGNAARAEQALEQALDNAGRSSTREFYKGKLRLLSETATL
ncbi:MAG: tetratricopeptide repeat protein [Pseudomonadota bacterium]